MSSDSKNAVALMGCVGLIPTMVLGICIRAWAITTLWAWFVTPTWHVLAPSGAAALGISSLLGLLVSIPTATDSKEGQSALAAMGTAYGKILLSPLGSVAFGWVVKHWM